MNAYTFDREMYRQWCVGGGVWIEDDPEDHDDSPVTFLQSCCIPAVTSTGDKGDTMSEDPHITVSYTHMCVST